MNILIHKYIKFFIYLFYFIFKIDDNMKVNNVTYCNLIHVMLVLSVEEVTTPDYPSVKTPIDDVNQGIAVQFKVFNSDYTVENSLMLTIILSDYFGDADLTFSYILYWFFITITSKTNNGCDVHY